MRNSNQSKKSTIDGLNYFDLYISQAEENAKLRSIVSSLKNELTEKDNKIEVRIFFLYLMRQILESALLEFQNSKSIPNNLTFSVSSPVTKTSSDPIKPEKFKVRM